MLSVKIKSHMMNVIMLSVVMMSVENKYLMLNLIILNVVMLNVMVRFYPSLIFADKSNITLGYSLPEKY